MAENASFSKRDTVQANGPNPPRVAADPGHAPTLPAAAGPLGLAQTVQAPVTPPTDRNAVSSELLLVSVPGTIPGPLQGWDRYEILRPLGQGGMGTVFLARDRRLGRLVALKFLRLPSPDANERMLQEARSQARLDHPGICKVFEVGEFQEQPYIAMEYIDGQPLHLALRRLTLEQKILLLQQTALAVHAAHSHGILHRDLKPANVMVCSPQAEASGSGSGAGGKQAGLRPVLMDFGLARDSLGPQRLTQTGVIMGTPHYMAPEQARGQARHLDRRADVYSLGAMLYEMLTGRPPFDAEHEVDLLLAVLNQDPPPPRQLEPSVPVDLEVIALKCLRKEPEHRYESALALAEDLQRYLHSEPILARPASTLYRIRRLAMRHRALVAFAVLLLLALGGVIGISWRAKEKERVAAVRADERQRLAAELGQTITKMNLFLRIAYSLPPHSLNHEQELMREQVRKLQQQLAGADPFLHGTLESAIGQGYLALGEYETAVEHLRRALALGTRTAGVHLALGQSLGRLYEERADELKRSLDPERARPEIERLRHELLVPARRELGLEKRTELMSSAYVRALLHFYSDNPAAEYDAALAAAREAQLEAPWLIEPLDLELKILTHRYGNDIGQGKSPSAAETQAVREAIERAIGVARSYPNFYASFNDYSLYHVKDMLLGSGNLKSADSVYVLAADKARVASILQPDSGAAYDQLADLYASWAYSLGWRQQDPRVPLASGLVAAKEALARPPARSRPYMARSKLHLAEMMYLDSQGEDSQVATEQALTNARDAARLDPKNSDIANLMVVSLSMLMQLKHWKGLPTEGEAGEILAAGRRSMELRPELPLPINNLASMYLEVARGRIDRGLDPTAELAQARKLAEVLQSRFPSYVLGKLCVLILEDVELKVLASRGQDTTQRAQQFLARAQQALKESNNYSYIQDEVMQAYLAVAEAMVRHPGPSSPGPIFDEALAQLAQFEQSGLGELKAQRNRWQLLLKKASWLKASRQSPEPVLAALLRTLEVQSVHGSLRSERLTHRARGLRLQADWLREQGRTAAALAAIDAGLSACEEARSHVSGQSYLLAPEAGALLTLKAQLARAAGERTQLAGKAVTLLSEALKQRPPLTLEFARFLKTAEALSAG